MTIEAGKAALDAQSLLHGQRFTNKLEEYISRTRHGIAPQDNSVPEELSQKLTSSNTFLSNNDPKLVAKYSGYLTAFSYDKRGRFVSNLDEAFTTTARLKGLKA